MIEAVVPHLLEHKLMPIQNEWASVVSEVNVHMKGHYPSELLEDWRTAYDKSDLAQIKKIFEPKTKALFLDGLNGAIEKVKNSNFQRSEIPALLQDYLKDASWQRGKEILNYEQLIEWLFKRAINDPNGYIIYVQKSNIIPHFSAEIPDLNQDEPDIDIQFISSEHIIPLPELVDPENPTSKHLAWSCGMWTYSMNNAKPEKAPFYYVLDEQDYFLVYPTGKREGKVIYEWISIYEHNLGYLPADPAKGIISTVLVPGGKVDPLNPKEKPKKIEVPINKSYMDAFMADGNDALLFYIDFKLNLRKCGYSTEIRKKIKCDKCDGEGKLLHEKKTEETGQEHYYKCSECKGTGICEANPNRIVYLPSEKGPYEDEPINPQNYSAWIERPTEPIKLNAQEYINAKEAARNTVLPPRQKNQAETSDALTIQRERYENFLRMMGNYFWHITQVSLNVLQDYIVPESSRTDIVITPARHYTVMSVEEQREEYRECKDNGDAYQASLKLNDIFNTTYKDNPVELKLYKVLQAFDRLLNTNEDTLVNKKVAGVFTLQMCQKHEMAPSIMEQLRNKYGPQIIDRTTESLVQEADQIFASINTTLV